MALEIYRLPLTHLSTYPPLYPYHLPTYPPTHITATPRIFIFQSTLPSSAQHQKRNHRIQSKISIPSPLGKFKVGICGSGNMSLMIVRFVFWVFWNCGWSVRGGDSCGFGSALCCGWIGLDCSLFDIIFLNAPWIACLSGRCCFRTN